MKRLIATLVLSFGIVLGSASTLFAAPRYWELQMFDPSQTTERTIRLAYNVSSTNGADTFTVNLFKNSDASPEATQTINVPNGDSRAFQVNIPATGTYTYSIEATNNGDGTKQTESRTVEVVNGPEPTVRTVFVNNEPDAPITTANAGGGGNNAAGGAVNDGQVAGAEDGEAANQNTNGENGEGQVTDEAANNQQEGSTENENGGVLGATDQANNSTRNNLIIALLILAGAAGSYYWFVQRPKSNL